MKSTKWRVLSIGVAEMLWETRDRVAGCDSQMQNMVLPILLQG